MKTLFNQNENAAKVLSHSAMKNVLGGYNEDKSPEEGGCRIHCTGWPADQYIGTDDCLRNPGAECGGDYDECICE